MFTSVEYMKRESSIDREKYTTLERLDERKKASKTKARILEDQHFSKKLRK
jgi:hypothetical protein